MGLFNPKIIKRDGGVPYLLRWHIIPRNPWFNVYLHKFVNDDDDRALHDHPWPSLSIRLNSAELWEQYVPTEFPDVALFNHLWRKPPRVCFRSADFAHRLELRDKTRPVWTLFITGKRSRVWGFLCRRGWVPWYEMTDLQGNPLARCDDFTDEQIERFNRDA